MLDAASGQLRQQPFTATRYLENQVAPYTQYRLYKKNAACRETIRRDVTIGGGSSKLGRSGGCTGAVPLQARQVTPRPRRSAPDAFGTRDYRLQISFQQLESNTKGAAMAMIPACFRRNSSTNGMTSRQLRSAALSRASDDTTKCWSR
jgi:hypothetical protein